jgi:CRISPR-associated protein (TIGR03986 family)
MAEGTIKWFDARKRYGYIEREGESDLFVHINQWHGVSGSVPQEGDKVAFDEGVDRKGRPEAQNVRPIEMGEAYRFLNPYNFVRYLPQPRPGGKILGDCPPPPHDRYVGLTGRITCQVKAVTPLFISDSHDVQDDNGHKTYRFFEYEGRPALPASSLRGMFRSVFEAVTNSCFVVFDSPRRLEYREKPEYGNKVKSGAGIVNVLPEPARDGQSAKDGEIVLCYVAKVGAYYEGKGQWKNVLHRKPNGGTWQCGDLAVARIERLKQGYVVRELAISQEQLQPLSDDEEYVEGWLKITGKSEGTTKRSEFLFLNPDKHGSPGKVLFGFDEMEEYNRVLEGQQSRDLPTSPQSPQLALGDLVWVEVEGKGRSQRARRIVRVQVPRIPYRRTIGELLPQRLHHCDNPAFLCPACRVFGWVHEKAPEGTTRVAYAGRVRFSHGRPLEGTIQQFDEPITLAILSTPKPTTTLFYLLDQDGRPADVTYDTQDARLRGRKMYRHHGESLHEREYQYAGDKPSDQNRTVKGVLKSGATFEFTLEFENMAEGELGALLWTLEFDGDAKIFHRLGLAKPLGFGSIEVQVTGLEVMSPRQRYTSFTAQADGWQDAIAHKDVWKQKFTDAMQGLYGSPFAELDNIQDLRALLSDLAPRPIHYPRSKQDPDPDGKNYEWFMGNKKHKKPLPLAADDAEGFPIWDKDGREV